MARTEAQVSALLVIKNNWNVTINGVASSLPAAIDTIGMPGGSGEVIIHTDFIDEEETVIPQIGITDIDENSTPVQNGKDEACMVRAIVWVPRNYSSLAPGILKNYRHQMSEEIKRIWRETIAQNEFWLSDEIHTLPDVSLLPNWITRELILKLVYII